MIASYSCTDTEGQGTCLHEARRGGFVAAQTPRLPWGDPHGAGAVLGVAVPCPRVPAVAAAASAPAAAAVQRSLPGVRGSRCWNEPLNDLLLHSLSVARWLGAIHILVQLPFFLQV